MARFTAAVFVSLFLASCMPLLPEDTPEEDTEKVSIQVRTICASISRSSIAPEENKADEINIYVYRNGILECECHEEGGGNVTLELYAGQIYDIYAFANAGEVHAPSKESDLSDGLVWKMESLYDLSRSVPMAGKILGVVVSSAKTLDIPLARLVSKISLRIDASLLPGLKITSARLCNSPSSIRPFAEEGSLAENPSQVTDGDYATDEDLGVLNEGGEICFYSLENCQGILLPSNTDPWSKTPDSIGNKAGTCTYIELDCVFDDESIFTGSVKYRIFPGEDNVTDFNIRRNSNLSITVCPTEDGLGIPSWKVTADIMLREDLATGRISQGRHPLNDLYVGESFVFTADADERLLQHFGRDLSQYCIRLVSQDGASMEFLEASSEPGKNSMQSKGKCLSPGTGSLWLCSPEGKKAAELSHDIQIRTPLISVSDDSSDPICTINGDEAVINFYLTDNDGNNLNTDSMGGFDLSLFDFTQAPSIDSPYDIDRSITVKTSPGVSGSGGPALTCMAGCINDGSDENMNLELCRAVSSSDAFRIGIREGSFGIEAETGIGMDFRNIRMSIVDNGWAKYHSSQMSLKTENQSNLPLNIYCRTVNTTNSSWNAIYRNEIIDKVENELDVCRMDYIAGSYCDDDAALYGSGTLIYSERNGGGDLYIEDKGQMIYPLEGLETEDINMVIAYDKRGQEALYSLFDVSIPHVDIPEGKISFADSLSDGSMKYTIIYGCDPENPGWNNQGVWLYSNSSLLSKGNGTLDRCLDISPRNLHEMKRRYSKDGSYAITLSYDQTQGVLLAYAPQGNPYGIILDAEIAGTVNGYVETHPDGTWGAAQENHCTATISRSVTGLNIGSEATAIDSGAIKAAMDEIYGRKYADSNNWIGSASSFQHRAHPTDINIIVKLKVNGVSGNGLYPVCIRWDEAFLPYYHGQDDKTYKVTLTSRMPSFSFVDVSRR